MWIHLLAICPRLAQSAPWTGLRRCLFAVLLIAGANAERPAGASAPTLSDVTIAPGVSAGAPVDPTDVFAAEDRSIYVWYRCGECAVGTVITSSWLWLEPNPPLEFARGSVAVERVDDFGEFHFQLTDGMRWSVGSYRVELLVDGVPAARATFTVAPPPTASGAHLRAEVGGVGRRQGNRSRS